MLYMSVLESIQNDDHGWGWKAGETSQTEPTSYALRALVGAGVREYVPLVFVRMTLASTNDEVRVLNQELAKLRSDLDARVREQIPGVIKERDRLFQEVKELQTVRKQDARRFEEEIDRLQAILENSSRETRIRIERILDEARNYYVSVEEGVSRLRTGAGRLLISWAVYGLVLTIAVSMYLLGRTPSFPVPLGAGIVTALTVILVVISILVWRRYRGLDIVRSKTARTFRNTIGRISEMPFEDLRMADVPSRKISEDAIYLRRAFERLAMISRELPLRERYEVLSAVEKVVSAPTDIRPFLARELLELEMMEMGRIPRYVLPELERALDQLSRFEVPSSIMRREFLRLRERVL